jgi:GntR family transcriptional regulator
MVPDETFVPIYYRLERSLREQIRNGTLKPGDPIPPESQLVEQFQTSRVTVRQALSRLVFEGLIVRQRGRGSFVAKPRFEHTNSMFWSFDEEMRARGATVEHKLLTMFRTPSEGRVAESLAIAEGTPVHRLERLGIVDHLVVAYELRFLPLSVGDALTPEELQNQSLVTAMTRVFGRRPSRIVVKVTSSAVRSHEARILETKVGAPVLVREHVWHLEAPILYGKTIFRGDRYAMTVEFKALEP